MLSNSSIRLCGWDPDDLVSASDSRSFLNARMMDRPKYGRGGDAMLGIEAHEGISC
jgi:hypothetical protein